MLSLNYMLLLPEEQTDQTWKPAKSNVLSQIGELWIEKYLHFFMNNISGKIILDF
jgi:hypothetical protein